MKTENNSSNRESRDRKKELAKKKRSEQILRGYKYRCSSCNQPFNISTAMNEKAFCSLRCEGTK